MNEQELVKLVTEKVIEALRQQEAASVPMPAAPQAQPAAGAQSGSCTGEAGLRMTVRDLEEAKPGAAPDEVVIGVAPAFGLSQVETINGLSHSDVLREIAAGIEEEGLHPRFVRFRDISDVSFIAQRAATLSGSGSDRDPPKGSFSVDESGAVSSGAADHVGNLPSYRQKCRTLCKGTVSRSDRSNERLYGAAKVSGARCDPAYQGNAAYCGGRRSRGTGGEVVCLRWRSSSGRSSIG